MAVDTPARIAIIGAGPIGLEAALYARFLGYDVDVYESRSAASGVLKWGHVRMFTPFGMNCSPLGLAALAAQDPDVRLPDPDALLTGQEWAELYLLPLSRTDLLADSIHEKCGVISISRAGISKTCLPGSEERIDYPFRLLTGYLGGPQQSATADVVIDASGTHPTFALGSGGGRQVGYMETLKAAGNVDQAVSVHLPDVLEREAERYANKHTLVIGAGHSAATNVVALAELARTHPETRVTWITRKSLEPDQPGPVAELPDDPLPERRNLAAAANRLARGESPAITHIGAREVEAIARVEGQDQFEVQLTGRGFEKLVVDRIIANVGRRPEIDLFRELQVHLCYATEGPMALAAKLAAQSGEDCLSQVPCGPDSLRNPEPDFYILGSKSYGRNPNFLYSIGREQVRELFTIIGDRPDLDLYKSIRPLA